MHDPSLNEPFAFKYLQERQAVQKVTLSPTGELSTKILCLMETPLHLRMGVAPFYNLLTSGTSRKKLPSMSYWERVFQL